MITPFSATFSKDKSTYIRLSRLLSRSNSFCHVTSDAPSPLYVDDLMPYYCQISLIRRPASTSFNIDTIGDPVNVDCRIGPGWDSSSAGRFSFSAVSVEGRAHVYSGRVSISRTVHRCIAKKAPPKLMTLEP